MPLIPIEYPDRLRSPDEARRLYRGLGDEQVGVRGFRTAEPAQIGQLVEAADLEREHTLTFETGLLDARGWARLAELAETGASYLDLNTPTAQLRSWREHTKVYARLPVDGIAGVAEAFGAPLKTGENRCGETTVMIDPVVGYPLAVALTTTDRALALRMFRALGQPTVSRGSLAGATRDAKAALTPFLQGLGATLHVALELQLDHAFSLASACPALAHDWHASEVVVDLPAGRIHGFLRTPDGDREQWLARVRTAVPADRR